MFTKLINDIDADALVLPVEWENNVGDNGVHALFMLVRDKSVGAILGNGCRHFVLQGLGTIFVLWLIDTARCTPYVHV